jgi:hypothetical protein
MFVKRASIRVLGYMYIIYIREYIYYGNFLVSVPFSREGCVRGQVAKETRSKRRLVLGPHRPRSQAPGMPVSLPRAGGAAVARAKWAVEPTQISSMDFFRRDYRTPLSPALVYTSPQ